MTSRQAGRRISTIAAERRKKPVRRGGVKRTTSRKNEPLRPKERRQLLQLVICSVIFVLLVAVKLLLPARMAQVNEAISSAMEQNMDVQAVFSAVGRAFSGESGAAADVYQAVFSPDEDDADDMVIKTAALVPQDRSALDTLQGYRNAAVPADMEVEEETGLQEDILPPPTAEVSTLAYVLYSEQNLPEGVSMEQALLDFDYCTPVNGTLSSDFGYREHPTEGEERFHYGIDLAADNGTEIACFADGTVTAVGESSSYGKYCIVAHSGGYSTLYAHCSRITASSGTAVTRGQKIAEVGETGMATGPHLHFELQRDGTYLNPIYYVSLA